MDDLATPLPQPKENVRKPIRSGTQRPIGPWRSAATKRNAQRSFGQSKPISSAPFFREQVVDRRFVFGSFGSVDECERQLRYCGCRCLEEAHLFEQSRWRERKFCKTNTGSVGQRVCHGGSDWVNRAFAHRL